MPAASWLPAPLPRLEPEAARAELARRWLRAYGPARVADLKWWSAWTLAQTRAALAAIGAVEVDLDGTPGVVLPDDVEREPQPEPWAVLLPALDPTVMGWKERSWYLGEHGPALFDRSGNAGPTVWWNGRIVGDYQAADNPKWFAEFHDDPATYRRFLEQCQRVLRNDRHLYIMFDSYSFLTLGSLVRDFFHVKNVVVWDKVKLGMGHYFRRRHELIVFATKGRRGIARRDIPDGDRTCLGRSFPSARSSNNAPRPVPIFGF